MSNNKFAWRFWLFQHVSGWLYVQINRWHYKKHTKPSTVLCDKKWCKRLARLFGGWSENAGHLYVNGFDDYILDYSPWARIQIYVFGYVFWERE